MKAVYGYVRQVKKQLTTNLAIIEVEIDKREYKHVVELLDDQTVLITIASPDLAGGYGVVDSEEPEQTEPEPKKFTELRPSAQAAIRCKEKGFQKWASNNMGLGDDDLSEHDCATLIRAQCGVASRAKLDEVGPAQDAWIKLENAFYCSRYSDMV